MVAINVKREEVKTMDNKDLMILIMGDVLKEGIRCEEKKRCDKRVTTYIPLEIPDCLSGFLEMLLSKGSGFEAVLGETLRLGLMELYNRQIELMEEKYGARDKNTP